MPTPHIVHAAAGVDEDCASIEISFHDTLKMPARIPLLSDPWGLSMASLSSSGALHASSTTLVYRYAAVGRGGVSVVRAFLKHDMHCNVLWPA